MSNAYSNWAMAGAAIALWSTATIPAAAQSVPQAGYGIFERQVGMHGLDLASAAGRAELRHRINHAARQVCREATGGETYADPGFLDCVRAAFADAWAGAELSIASAEGGARVAAVK